MGCDIHQYAERRVDGRWVAEQAATYGNQAEADEEPWYSMTNSGDSDRNYWLFGVLSEGVRKSWAPGIAFEAKGEPDDASPEVASMIKQWEGDGHSHNYLTFTELKQKAAELMLQDTQETKEANAELVPWIASFGETPDVADEDRRVVFWFDN